MNKKKKNIITFFIIVTAVILVLFYCFVPAVPFSSERLAYGHYFSHFEYVAKFNFAYRFKNVKVLKQFLASENSIAMEAYYHGYLTLILFDQYNDDVVRSALNQLNASEKQDLCDCLSFFLASDLAENMAIAERNEKKIKLFRGQFYDISE